MTLLRHFVMVCLLLVALATNGQVYSIEQLHPGTNSIDFNFSVAVTSWQTGDSVHFKVTVAPKPPGPWKFPEPLYSDARCMMFDGRGMIELWRLAEPEQIEDTTVYTFEVASRFLESSQFIFRYSAGKDVRKREGVDSIWFFLRDFAPKAAPNTALEPTGTAPGISTNK